MITATYLIKHVIKRLNVGFIKIQCNNKINGKAILLYSKPCKLIILTLETINIIF